MLDSIGAARTPQAGAQPAFLRFYASQVFGYVADGLRTLAIPLLVFKLTGSAISLGWTFAFELMPFALVSLVGGSLADRLPRRPLMLACDAARCAIAIALTVAYATNRLSLPLVYLAVFALSSAGAVLLGAQSSSVPYLLGADRSRGGVAALAGAENLVNLVAPPVGGALLAGWGALPALAMIAAIYGAAQIAIATVPTLGPDRPSGMPGIRQVFADIRSGWNVVRADAALHTMAWSQVALNFFGVMGWVAIIPYLEREFGLAERGVGFAMGCIALGSFCGSIAAGRTRFRFGTALIVAYWLDALFWLPTIWATNVVIAVGAIAVSAAFATYRISSMIAWRMRVIPEEYIGRTFGVVRCFAMGSSLPGALLGGWITDHGGSRATMAVSGIGWTVLALMLAFAPSIRREAR